MKNVAVILAGGTGSRMYNEAVRSTRSGAALLPKQFMQLQGRAVIEYPIETFCGHPAIEEVAVVVHPEWRGEMEAIVARNGWCKVTRVLDGGRERYMSSLNAVMSYKDYPDDTNLLLHDAARPWVTEATVGRVVEALEHYEAVGVGVPATDTVWEVQADMDPAAGAMRAEVAGPRFVARIPDRRLMWLAQTPQAFRLPLIRDAYQRALEDPQFSATDDCGVVRRYVPGVHVYVVEGDAGNVKITYPEDIKREDSNHIKTRI